jgi:hypothetical protein
MAASSLPCIQLVSFYLPALAYGAWWNECFKRIRPYLLNDYFLMTTAHTAVYSDPIITICNAAHVDNHALHYMTNF